MDKASRTGSIRVNDEIEPWDAFEIPLIVRNPLPELQVLKVCTIKNVIGDPNNPDLIEVRTRFVIPSLAGEKRSGDYDPSAQYPTVTPAP